MKRQRRSRSKPAEVKVQMPSMVEFLILKIMMKNIDAMHGREIVEHSNGFITYAGVYVQLARMLEKGLIVLDGEDRDEETRGVPRKRYSLNALGVATYQKVNEVGQD